MTNLLPLVNHCISGSLLSILLNRTRHPRVCDAVQVGHLPVVLSASLLALFPYGTRMCLNGESDIGLP
ncbi:MAG: hypothetical protein DCC55_16955 [Chloroflexi bacterium]|nr:MAG: hypothetical protein DCC55_16955 [Chloroflexota bacterium]